MLSELSWKVWHLWQHVMIQANFRPIVFQRMGPVSFGPSFRWVPRKLSSYRDLLPVKQWYRTSNTDRIIRLGTANGSKTVRPSNIVNPPRRHACGSKKGVSLTLKNSVLIPVLPWVVAELSGVRLLTPQSKPILGHKRKPLLCAVLAKQKPLCPHSFWKRCQNATQTLATSTKSHVRNTLILTNYGQ